MAGTRKAAELIKLVTYCNNMNAYCANLSCKRPRAHSAKKNAEHSIIIIIIYLYSGYYRKRTGAKVEKNYRIVQRTKEKLSNWSNREL